MSNLPTIYHKQWTDKSFIITITKDWVIEDITDYEIYFVVRSFNTLSDDDDNRAVIDKQAVIADGTTGKATLNLTRDDTLDIPVSEYIYEISYKKSNDQVISHYWYWTFNMSYLSNKVI